MVWKVRANGLRYRRGGRARLADIIARNFANRAASCGAIAPSGARFVRRTTKNPNATLLLVQ